MSAMNFFRRSLSICIRRRAGAHGTDLTRGSRNHLYFGGELFDSKDLGEIMQPRQLFGVAVRTSGLVFLVFSLLDLSHMVARLMEIPTPSQYPIVSYAWGVGLYLFFCAILLRGADWIVCFAYGRDRSVATNTI